MREFAYRAADDVASAVALLAERPDAKFLGGGTNLVDLMKLGVERPSLLVDVSGLPLDHVDDLESGGVRIGAMARNSDLAAHRGVRLRYPAVAQAVLAGASGQLRNLATVGGNVLQRTRCVYFTDVGKPCNKREPGSGCSAIDGEHRNLAILGGSDHCVATNPSDLAVALVALDATVQVHEPAPDGGTAGDGTAGGTASGGGTAERTLPLRELYRLPGDEPHRETTLHPAALITAIELPALPWAARSRYRKVRDRASYAFAIGSIAAAVDVREGVVRDVRIALGAVAPVPWRATAAEDALRGQEPTPAAFAAAADAELAAARPLRDNAFKTTLVRNLIVRTLTELTEPAAADGSTGVAG